MIITVEEGQTISDIADQEYGCTEGMVLICEDNGLAVDDDLLPNQALFIRVPVPDLNGRNQEVARLSKSKGTIVNSSYKASAESPENDFYIDDFYDNTFYE